MLSGTYRKFLPVSHTQIPMPSVPGTVSSYSSHRLSGLRSVPALPPPQAVWWTADNYVLSPWRSGCTLHWSAQRLCIPGSPPHIQYALPVTTETSRKNNTKAYSDKTWTDRVRLPLQTQSLCTVHPRSGKYHVRIAATSPSWSGQAAWLSPLNTLYRTDCSGYWSIPPPPSL